MKIQLTEQEQEQLEVLFVLHNTQQALYQYITEKLTNKLKELSGIEEPVKYNFDKNEGTLSWEEAVAYATEPV